MNDQPTLEQGVQLQNDISSLENTRVYQQDIVPGAIKPKHLTPSKTQANGDLYYSDGTNFIKLPIGNTTDIFTAQGGIPSWKNHSVYKTTDQSVNNTSTLQNDNELFYSLEANSVWQFYALLLYFSGTTPDIKFHWTVPSGSSMAWFDFFNGTGQKDETTTLTQSAGGTNQGIFYQGVIFTGSTAGTFQLQWAQNTADLSNTYINQGSYLLFNKLA